MTVESASVSSTTVALFGPTSVTRPASAPPAAITHVPDLDAVVGALVERDRRRRNSTIRDR